MAETNASLVLGIVNMVLLLVVLGVVAAIGAKLHLASSGSPLTAAPEQPRPRNDGGSQLTSADPSEVLHDVLSKSGAEHLDKNLVLQSRIVPSRKDKLKEFAMRATTGSRSLSGAGPAGRKMRK